MQQINREKRQAEKVNNNRAEKKGEYQAEPKTRWKGEKEIKRQ